MWNLYGSEIKKKIEMFLCVYTIGIQHILWHLHTHKYTYTLHTHTTHNSVGRVLLVSLQTPTISCTHFFFFLSFLCSCELAFNYAVIRARQVRSAQTRARSRAQHEILNGSHCHHNKNENNIIIIIKQQKWLIHIYICINVFVIAGVAFAI